MMAHEHEGLADTPRDPWGRDGGMKSRLRGAFTFQSGIASTCTSAGPPSVSLAIIWDKTMV